VRAAYPFVRIKTGTHARSTRASLMALSLAPGMYETSVTRPAAVATNGFRFRVPYGTLLCVSDKPLHREIKLAGMAGDFYRRRVG